MRSHAVAAVALLAFSHGVEARSGNDTSGWRGGNDTSSGGRSGNDTSSGGVGFPKCAVPCVVETLGAACLGFDPKNKSCACFRDDEEAKYALCVTTACPIADGLKTARLTKMVCNSPVRNVGPQYTVQQYVFMTLSGLAVALRLLSKTLPSGSPDESATLGFDDLCIALAYVFLVPTVHVNATLLVAAGLGRDIWTLSPAQIRLYGYYFYLSQPLYFAVTGLVRVAFLAFFLRVFGTTGTACMIFQRWNFAVVVKISIVLSFMAMVAFITAVIFQCTPVSYVWDRLGGMSTGTCINSGALINTNSTLSIFMDLWILYLPLSQVDLLIMPRRKKLQLASMFSVGFIATIVGVVRMHTFYVLKDSMNRTWDSYPLVAWSSLEMHAGIICACMPALRIFCVRTVPANWARLRGRWKPASKRRPFSRAPAAGQSKESQQSISLSSLPTSRPSGGHGEERSGASVEIKPVFTVFGSDAEDTAPPDPLRGVHPGTEYTPGTPGKPAGRRLTPNFFAVSYKGGRV